MTKDAMDAKVEDMGWDQNTLNYFGQAFRRQVDHSLQYQLRTEEDEKWTGRQ
jgi:hypothetical protein